MEITDKYLIFKEYLVVSIRMLMLVFIIYAFYTFNKMNEVTEIRLQAAQVEKAAAIEGFIQLKNLIDQQSLDRLNKDKSLKKELERQGVVTPDMLQ